MGGGLIQLVAYGIEDIYLTKEPQITYFKIVYRRHTNFSTEQIPVYFVQDADFGQRVSCTVSPEGDLVNGVALVIKIPKVNPLSNLNETSLTVDSSGTELFKYNRFAWVRRIGYAMIKYVEVEINGRVIDRHYGEWLHIWNELVGPRDRGHDKNIGDIPELYDYTESKEEYTLMVPLQFWFCRSPGLALPLVALQYSTVKINIEFNVANKCYSVLPTHYIECNNDLTNFKKYEYIEQTIDGVKRAGLFVHYDIINKRLYYLKLTKNKLIGIEYDGDKSLLTQSDIDTIFNSDTALKYQIVGSESQFIATPNIGVLSKSNYIPPLDYLSIVNSYLLVDYVFLDEEERIKISQSKHDYLIEQLYFTPSTKIEGTNRKVKISVNQPCKLGAWIVQLDNIDSINDSFNYTDSYKRKKKVSDLGYITFNDYIGKSLIEEETLLLNGKERISMRPSEYFTNCQPHQHFEYEPSVGTNIYSFGLFPSSLQPSGACNMGQIDSVEVKMKFSSAINVINTGKFRAYCLVENVVRISNGLMGLLFT
jgi:hypothetical protein